MCETSVELLFLDLDFNYYTCELKALKIPTFINFYTDSRFLYLRFGKYTLQTITKQIIES